MSDEKTLVAIFLKEIITLAALEIRKTLAALPNDEARFEAIHAAGFCVRCGAQKHPSPAGSFDICYCTADD
jgi:hypothetical protein